MIEQLTHSSQNWAIQIKTLTKYYNERLVLKGIDLNIEPGKMVVILGPNGAGKTTLIKIMSTIMSFSAGRVVIDGLDVKKDPEKIRRRIGLVSHNTFLYGNLTAYENLNFYRRLYDLKRESIFEVALKMDMTARLNDRIDTLSRGMQQRIAISRALLHKPKIILLDEPETGLDQQSANLFWGILKGDEKEKPTVVMTTHNLELGLALADRFIILSQGKIVYQEDRKALDLNNLKEAYRISTRVSV